VDADDVEIRILGSLVEKQRVTPDVYPLTVNALRLACNQATNRDPVVEYDESDVRAGLDRLSRRGWARLATWRSTRSPKYRHLLDEALGVDEAELAVLCVLMLRGPQTPGELKARAERLHPFASREDVEATLERLAGRRLAAREGRRPGQKEDRFAHLLGGGAAAAAAAPRPAAPTAPPDAPSEPAAPPASDLAARVERLEREVAELRREVAAARGG
jgi:uncharacterized protein YceH (UPF0502 family)